MGIQDRDYMSERYRRRTIDWSMGTRRRTLASRTGLSVLCKIACWIILGYALYYAFGWWQENRHTENARRAIAAVQRAQAAAMRLVEPRAEADPPAQGPQLSRPTYPPQAAVQPEVPEPLSAQRNPPETSRVIYLCKAYSGSTFWSQAHCAQHQSLIDSIVSVPPGMPFEQQVQLAQQQRRQAISETVPAPAAPVGAESAAAASGAECRALDARVAQLDAMARAPQSAQTKDWLREQRRAARDRQFAIRC
jgi:hypothetical protein